MMRYYTHDLMNAAIVVAGPRFSRRFRTCVFATTANMSANYDRT